MTRRSEKSGHPADLASKPGSLQLPPNVIHKTLERLRNWTEVLELVTGKVETCSYNSLTPEPSVFQLGPVDPDPVNSSTKSRGPGAPSDLWSQQLSAHASQGREVEELGWSDSSAHLDMGREAGRAL